VLDEFFYTLSLFCNDEQVDIEAYIEAVCNHTCRRELEHVYIFLKYDISWRIGISDGSNLDRSRLK